MLLVGTKFITGLSFAPVCKLTTLFEENYAHNVILF